MDLSLDYKPKMSREAMKDEALERMELLDLPGYAKAALKTPPDMHWVEHYRYENEPVKED